MAPGQTGPPNPVNLAMGKIKMILDIINSMNIYFEKFYNNPTDRSEFTDPYSDRYILSRSVFINSKKDSGQSLLDAEERSRIT